MQLTTNSQGGAMKLPSLRNIERTLKMVPLVKDMLPINSESESSLLKLIKQQEDALHDKKAEIFTLRQTIKDLEEDLDGTKWMLTKAEEELLEEKR
tara:strand:+ start:947 stop:1234 length:288 start_codon:yes stop_codon:yes gene_type:complete